MDRTDLKILDALQSDGRLSNQRLSEMVGTSTAACWRRVRALEDSGIIDGYAALLNRQQLGLNLCAFVHITLARHVKESTAPFEEAVMARPEVMRPRKVSRSLGSKDPRNSSGWPQRSVAGTLGM